MQRKVYIFEEKINPSTDYYLIPAFKKYDFFIKRISIWADSFTDIEDGAWVVVVRYLNKKLVKFLNKSKSKIERLIYFMDDGLWDLNTLKDLPFKYAIRIFKKAYLYKKTIRDLDAEVWVSTDYLYEKYKNWKAKVIYPYPLDIFETKIEISNQPVVFYHGTTSHKKEIKWLSRIAEKLSSICPNCLFEIFLDEANFKHFKKLKNIVPLRPLGWESYLKFSSLQYRSIGLVPLFDYEFNRGRSWIKFYDITRAGAVGIFSDHAPYANLIKEFEAGLVLPMKQKLWIDWIIELVGNGEKRRKLYANALRLTEYLKEKAIESYRRAIFEE